MKLRITPVLASAFILTILPFTAAAAGLDVEFETGAPPTPLFTSANFVPGDSVTRWVKVTNTTPDPQIIGMQVVNFADPDDLAEQIDMVVASSATTLFSGTLQQLYDAGELELTGALAASATVQYDITATFNPSAGNNYQNDEVEFDFVFGILVVDALVPTPGGSGSSSGGPSASSGSSGGGSFNPTLSGAVTGGISGIIFNDLNVNGTFDGNDIPLPGWIVFLDANSDKALDAGESNQVTDAGGAYEFSNLAPGTYAVRSILQGGWSYVVPDQSEENQHVVLVAGVVVAHNDFGLIRGQVAGISDAAPTDDPGATAGQVLAAVDELPKTGVSYQILLGICTLAAISGISKGRWKKVF